MKKILAVFLLLMAVSAGTLIWQRSRLPAWISQKLQETLSDQFLKGTGAVLEELQFRADLWSFLFGHDGSLSFRVRYQAFLFSGEGPISIHLEREELRFKYLPAVQVHQEEATLFGTVMKVNIVGEVPTSNPVATRLRFQVDPTDLLLGPLSADFSGAFTVTTADVAGGFRGKKARFKTAEGNLLECSDFKADFSRSKKLRLETGCAEILLQANDDSWMGVVKNQRLQVETDLEFYRGQGVLKFGETEVLLGSVLLGLADLKFHDLRFDFEGLNRLVLNWGALGATLRKADPGDRENPEGGWSLSWAVKALNLKSVVDPVIDELSKRRWKVGALQVEGSGRVLLEEDLGPAALLKRTLRETRINVSASLENPKAQLRAQRIQLALRPGSVEEMKGLKPLARSVPLVVTIEAEELGWRGMDGRLYPSVMRIQVRPEAELARLEVDGVGEIKIAMKEIDAVFEPLRVRLSQGDQKLFERMSFETAIKASTQSVAGVLEKVCLPWPKQWATSLDVQWKRVSLEKGRLKLDGQTKVSVIGGEIVTGPIEIDNAMSSARLTRFTTRIRDLQLRDLGEPIQFGEMDGTLKGDLEDVELIGLVPRRYRARFELLPNTKREVIFSAIAMKNFVSLFTPEDFSGNIPGPLKELAFGWLSRVLGGYNIKYAGLSLSAVDDSILLETLDPEWMVRSGGQRYLLYGTRFKIPLQSLRYPVVLDAPGLTNFVLHVQSVLSELGRKAKPSEEITSRGDNDVSKEYCSSASDHSE